MEVGLKGEKEMIVQFDDLASVMGGESGRSGSLYLSGCSAHGSCSLGGLF